MEESRKELKTFEGYQMRFPSEIQERLEEIRSAIKNVVPDVEERISYNMPSFKFHGNLVYYGAFKNHIGFYPASKTVFEKFQDELKDYKQSGRGTVQFQHDEPLPIELIKEIAKFRADENIKKN